MSSAELADGLLADDYEELQEDDWVEPARSLKGSRKKQPQKMTSELDKDSVFQQGYA
jgi:hypothetical protein